MDGAWLKSFLLKAAEEQIEAYLSGRTKTAPVATWEIETLKQGMDQGHISLKNGNFQIAGKSWSLLQLNREYITHSACFVELMASEEFLASEIKVEYERLDIVILKNEKPDIAIEIKTTTKLVEDLANGIREISQNPPSFVHGSRNDSLQKVTAILRVRPREFWIFGPEIRLFFNVEYSENGFTLKEARKWGLAKAI